MAPKSRILGFFVVLIYSVLIGLVIAYYFTKDIRYVDIFFIGCGIILILGLWIIKLDRIYWKKLDSSHGKSKNTKRNRRQIFSREKKNW